MSSYTKYHKEYYRKHKKEIKLRRKNKQEKIKKLFLNEGNLNG